MTMMKDMRYGGALKACDASREWPISWIIRGRKTGMEENAMLVKKNMKAVK